LKIYSILKKKTMKRIVPISALIITVGIAASCGVPTSREVAADKLGVSSVTVQDTIGMAEFKAFQEWKSQKELEEYKAFVKGAEEPKSSSVIRTVANRNTSASRRSNTVSYPVATAPSTSQQPVEQKKGWSKAAKGAAIGAGSGAIAGAVINKRNRAVGAVIGGVVGGGVGYGIGRHMDKKDGRY
jgi:hypothetical protein